MKKLLTATFAKSALALTLIFQVGCSSETIEDTAVETTENEVLSAEKIADREKPEDGNTYYIRNYYSRLFLDVTKADNSNGANIQQWEYTGAKNQQWKVIDLGDGLVRLRSESSKKCLDVAKMSKSNGGNVHQWGYWGGENQKWQLKESSGALYWIANENSSRLLEVGGYSNSNGGNIQQWENNIQYSNQRYNQLWEFIPVQ